MLSTLAEQAAAAGDQRAAMAYAGLHDQLLSMTTFGQRMLARQAAADSITPQTTREELLEKVIAASEDERLPTSLMGAR
ncbi:MAG: hypothetical protein HZY76_15900 [Anaerolineae bacterium]|nr:MAG: hypothetical protein HZY76_15900 [Anaerolineae bacterium]